MESVFECAIDTMTIPGDYRDLQYRYSCKHSRDDAAGSVGFRGLDHANLNLLK